MKISLSNSKELHKLIKNKENKTYTDKNFPYLALMNQSRGEPTWYFMKKVNGKLYSESLLY